MEREVITKHSQTIRGPPRTKSLSPSDQLDQETRSVATVSDNLITGANSVDASFAYHFDTDGNLNIHEDIDLADKWWGPLYKTSSASNVIIGKSAPMVQVFTSLSEMAPSRLPILFRGPSGTGRSTLADWLAASTGGKLTNLSCIGLSDLETVILGNTRGSGTEHPSVNDTCVEETNSRVFFIRNLENASLALQAEILSFTESRGYWRLDENGIRKASPWLLFGADHFLEEKWREGQFQEALYYRISTFCIELPPLRERGDDVLLLAVHFLRRLNAQRNVRLTMIAQDAVQSMREYAWPGNVRELESAISRAAMRTQGHIISAKDLGLNLHAKAGLPQEVAGRKPAHPIRKLVDERLQRPTDGSQDANGTLNNTKPARALGVPSREPVEELEQCRIGLGTDGAPQPDFDLETPAKDSSAGQEESPTKVSFGTSSVTVNGQDFERNEAWNLLEYFLWRNDWVRWPEGHLVFPMWLNEGVKNGQKLFREKVDKCAKILVERYGLNVKFQPNRKRNAERWNLLAPGLTTNITEADEHYQKAKKLFEEWKTLAAGPQPLLANEKLVAAKATLLEALKIYPNHLESHVLLARCYENLQTGDVSPQEIESAIRPSWEFLDAEHKTLERLRRLDKDRPEAPLLALVAFVERHPALSQVGRCERILWTLLYPAIAERDPALAKLKNLLSQMGTTNDETTLRNLVELLLHLPCVLEVVKENDALMEAVSGFMTDSGELDVSRIQALSNLRFNTIEEFQAYLKTTLRGIGEEHRAEDSPRQGPVLPDSIRRKMEQLKRVQQNLQHELGRKPSEDELEEALKVRMTWGPDDLKEIMQYRRRPQRKQRARPPKGM
jgi:transcriptional regulator with AAA-type ATPase domain/tetratricopeptide (TPR) repeat protein